MNRLRWASALPPARKVEPVIADEVFKWMLGITERGEYLKLLLKGTPPGDEREAMLASTLRLIEKCWEEMAELEAQTRGRDGHSLGGAIRSCS